MSGLPIINAPSVPALAQRDPLPPTQAPTGQAAPALARTQTENAVGQPCAARAVDHMVRRRLPAESAKTMRHVGPPPAFEVNILQDIQETRAEGRETEPATDKPADAAQMFPPQDATDTPAYAELIGLESHRERVAALVDLEV